MWLYWQLPHIKSHWRREWIVFINLISEFTQCRSAWQKVTLWCCTQTAVLDWAHHGSDEDLTHQAKTSTKTSTDIYQWKKHPFLKLQDYRICSSIFSQVSSKLIWSKISWVTEIWKEQFVKGKMISLFLGLKEIKEAYCRFCESIQTMFSDQISQFWQRGNCFM